MRVWYVTMFFPGPRETFAANDLRALQRAGVSVAVHALRRPYPNAEALRVEYGVTGIPASNPTRMSWLRGLAAGLARPRVLLAALRFVIGLHVSQPQHLVKSLALLPRSLELYARAEKEQPDVVHLFWGHYPSLVGWLVKTRLGIPVTTFLGTYDLLTGLAGSFVMARASDAVFTHARGTVPALLAAGVPAEKIHVAYRGVHPDLLSAPRIAKERCRIVIAGALEAPKRMDAALDVFAKVQERWPDARLTICGDGPERSRLEAQAARLRNVEFRGYVAHREVFAEMQRAEVFLFLSCADYDRLPNVVKEAIAARCYCVVGTTVGIEELVPGPEYGCVVAEGAWGDAVRAIDTVFAQPDRREEVVERALAHLAAHFDVDATMAEYRKVWSAIVA